jgi:hypothetical protein
MSISRVKGLNANRVNVIWAFTVSFKDHLGRARNEREGNISTDCGHTRNAGMKLLVLVTSPTIYRPWNLFFTLTLAFRMLEERMQIQIYIVETRGLDGSSLASPATHCVQSQRYLCYWWLTHTAAEFPRNISCFPLKIATPPLFHIRL